MKRILASLVALALSASAAFAHDFTLGSLEIGHPASKATLPGQPVGGGFMTITNKGGEADRLLAIAAPDVSDDVQLHEMAIENDVMKMRQLPDGIEIPAGATVELKSGGLHVMFMRIKHPFKEGETFKATLTFEKAGAVEVDFKIGAAKPGAAAHGDDAAADHGGHGG
ncbi:copper chaperone PCu(A)C [Shinella sp. S4-D37]|uniref:copper chaperone PCu(A)C n=1 Tax=Shinella sp. S4-D37 TaxID=3161999 RepID=UPI003465347E